MLRDAHREVTAPAILLEFSKWVAMIPSANMLSLETSLPRGPQLVALLPSLQKAPYQQHGRAVAE